MEVSFLALVPPGVLLALVELPTPIIINRGGLVEHGVGIGYLVH